MLEDALAVFAALRSRDGAAETRATYAAINVAADYVRAAGEVLKLNMAGRQVRVNRSLEV